MPLRPHNRWASAKVLREGWLQHIDTSLVRPVLLVDEAQEMHAAVPSELRLLTSAELDSRSILTVVLAGDDLYGELKHIRNALDQILASARFAARVQRHARQLDLLVSTHRLLARRPTDPRDHTPDQLNLF